MSELVRSALATIVDGGTLSMDEAHAAMGAVMDGEATPAQLAAFLMGLRMRGETADELAGFAGAMRDRVVRVDAPEGAIDVVGTGGDGSGTFNISTTAALVAAAAGVPVAKHGNRAMTSKSGSRGMRTHVKRRKPRSSIVRRERGPTRRRNFALGPFLLSRRRDSRTLKGSVLMRGRSPAGSSAAAPSRARRTRG